MHTAVNQSVNRFDVEVRFTINNPTPHQLNARYMLVFSDGVEKKLYRCVFTSAGGSYLNKQSFISLAGNEPLEKGYYIFLLSATERDNVADYVATFVKKISDECLEMSVLISIFNESNLFLDKTTKSLMANINVRELEIGLFNCCDELAPNTLWGDKKRGMAVCRLSVEEMLLGRFAEQEVLWHASRNYSQEVVRELYRQAYNGLFSSLRNPINPCGKVVMCEHNPTIAQWYWREVREYAIQHKKSHVSEVELKKFEDGNLRYTLDDFIARYERYFGDEAYAKEYYDYGHGVMERTDEYRLTDALAYGFIWDRIEAVINTGLCDFYF